MGAIPKAGVPEVQLKFYKSARKRFLGEVEKSDDVAEFIASLYKKGEMALREQIIVLYLNRNNQIIGYYRHSTGGISGTVVDIRLILSAALKSNSTSLIVAHNHPSGKLQASKADIAITNKLKEAAEIMDIVLLDHIIVTEKGHLSFADQGMLGLSGCGSCQSQTDDLEGVPHIVDKLRLQILRLLKQCNPEATPKICEHIQTKDGYRKIETLAISIVITSGISPGAAIAQIESELL